DSLCRRPGKPVPFVPVIDENVRKWYASDSLWQAHDPRYTADQVLAIPGPVAVSGIQKVDEPIGELLGRFVQGLTDALGEPAGRALRQPRLRTSSEGLTRGWTNAGLDIQAQEGATCWDAALTDVGGPVVDALLAEDGWAQGRRVPNPIRKLCETRDGASLLIAEDGHTATWTFEDERVSLTASATGLTIAVHPRLAGEATVWSFDARLEGGAIVHDLDPSLAIFYPAALFGEALPEVPLFSTTRETVTVTPDRAEAYARVTGRVNPEGLASDLVFSLTWKPLFAALQACPEGMLRLVHLEHGVEVGPDGLPEPGESVEVSARLTRVEDGARGRTIHAIAQVDGGRRATLHAMFFVRGDASHTPWAVRALEDRSATLVIDGAAREFLATHDDITLTGELTDRVMVEVELGETRHRDGRADGHAIGTLFNGETVLGHIEMKGSFEGSHPIGAMIDALKADEATDAATPPLTLATVQDVAPVNPAAFARIGRDYNPIHVSPVMARFADLDGPIVHGLWSAARCTAFVVDHAADGDATRITHSRVQFLAPVAPGAPIELKAVRRSLKDGARNIEVTLSTSEGIAVRGTWTVAPYKVAYVFPGQGIQRPGMGMDGYARSRAAKRVWEAADRVSRDKLGFSLLRVVRDNPTELRLPEGQVRHPEGVLHLTQFTQVAMATLAMAQIQELDEAGALIPGATFCGHSVGEYAALAAYGRVLPLEAVIELVWRRGLTMHTLVPRDEHGESGYRMGVVRPHHAGLPAEQVEGLLEEVRAETGGFVEIVNYNVRGRQYAVTGETKTLRVLEKRLMARQKGKKAPWLLVPGIDVPFHSTALVPGVDAFRDKLNRCMPQEVDVASLIGRYVPNLVARPFELTRPFALAILEVVDAQIVRDLLDRWDEAMADRNAVARILLIELLAWQFASPVRWIETQDLLLQPAWRKGLGLDTIIEVGVGYQPTLANMAKQTRVALGIDMPVLHVEADRDLVFSQDTDLPEPVAAPEVEASDEPAAAPVAEAAPAPVAAPTGPVGAPPEIAPGTAEVLRWMIALQSKRRLDQLSHLETLEEIFDGVSSRVNQLLLDVGQELGVGAIDGAAQLPLGELITTMESKVRYRGPGPYRTARHDAACAQVLGPCGWSKRDLEQHLASTYQFGEGLVSDALDELVTGTREGTSTAGGDLGGLPTRAADVAEAKALARQLAERLAARHGFGLAG
ncbi:MAG: acyltransferase domain-containing protein, partial [Myxococcota bacterium]